VGGSSSQASDGHAEQPDAVIDPIRGAGDGGPPDLGESDRLDHDDVVLICVRLLRGLTRDAR
jgi:hypothetical protein